MVVPHREEKIEDTKGKIRSHKSKKKDREYNDKTLRRKLKIEQHIPTKTGGELRWQGRVSSSCSHVISHE